MRRTLVALLALPAMAIAACGPSHRAVQGFTDRHQAALGMPSARQAQTSVQVLASDVLAGRRAGTPGAAKAAEWIAGEFKAIGLQPAGTDGYYLPFTFPYEEHTALPELTLAGEHPRSLQYRRDFAATLPSGPGDVEAEVVFVGYAMVAPELHYDDFAGVDLKGKIALVVRGAPGVGAEIKPEYRAPEAKDANVAAHGGVGILYVVRPREYQGNELQRKYSVMTPVKLPAVEVSPAVAAELLGQGLDLARVMEAVDRQHKPHSFPTGQRVRLRTQVAVDDRRPDRDVLGLLPGTDPQLRDRFVIIGAHYDHMGVDADGQIFRGAYDNASGVATMLEAARALAGDPPRISVLFAAWGAEESGMIGSDAYRHSSLFQPEKLVGVVNLDAIGHADAVTIELSRTDKDAPRVFDFAKQLGVHYTELDQLSPSDGQTFSRLPVPVIQFVDEASADHIHILDDRPGLVDGRRLAALAQAAALQAWWWGDHPPGR